jgi:hypothetical protein
MRADEKTVTVPARESTPIVRAIDGALLFDDRGRFVFCRKCGNELR